MPSAASRSGVCGVSWRSGPDQPTGRVPVACSALGDRVTDILPLLILGHADVEDAPAREAVRDELGVAPLPLLDQERVVVGDGLVERQGRFDAVFVQDGEDTKDADAIAVLVVAVAADIGKIRLVPAPQPLGAARG